MLDQGLERSVMETQAHLREAARPGLIGPDTRGYLCTATGDAAEPPTGD